MTETQVLAWYCLRGLVVFCVLAFIADKLWKKGVRLHRDDGDDDQPQG